MKIRKWGIALLLLLSLVVLTGCEVTPTVDNTQVAYENSRTAALFGGMKNGKIKMTFTTDVMDRIIQGTFYADLGANKAQVHVVRNSYDIYQRDEKNTCYVLDVNEKQYTEDTSGSSGALSVARVLTTGGNGTLKLSSRIVDDLNKHYDCESMYDGDTWVATCYFDGMELKYLYMNVMDNWVLAKIDSLTFSFDDSEMEIRDFPAQYQKVTELKRLTALLG